MLALVTGGTKGVGREIVSMLSSKKIPTIYTGRRIPDKESFDNSMTIAKELDLTNMDSIHDFLTDLRKENLEPNILIHNAGILSIKPKEHSEKIRKMFMANAIGPILLTQELLPKIKQGHIMFNAPPYSIDDKVKYLTPYMQSKLSQTTYMRSIAHILQHKPISVNSFWTGFPLWTDALELRNIGSREQCMHPNILAKVVEEIIFNEDAVTFKGHEIIDKDYLLQKNISLEKYQLGDKVKGLDEMFLSHLFRK